MTEIPEVHWIAAEENRFGVPILDLTPVTQAFLATTSDPENAARATSWRSSVGDELEVSELEALEPEPCELRFAAAADLPEGMLSTPASMEEKWVLAYRGGRLIGARSWTGQVDLLADTRRDGTDLVITALRVPEESALRGFGELAEVVDWVVRTHALGQVLPIPASETLLEGLERTPLIAFSVFGNKAICAARSWEPPPPKTPLRSDGRLLLALRAGDADRVRALVAAGEPLDAPTTYAGYTGLYLTLIQGDLAMTRLLLELGADPNARADQGFFPLGAAVVHGASLEAMGALIAAGADPGLVNADGFGALHAAAESGNGAAIPWLVARGLDLEAKTAKGYTALHIGCGLGKLEAVRELLAAGADPEAGSPSGRPAEIAAKAGHDEVAALF